MYCEVIDQKSCETDKFSYDENKEQITRWQDFLLDHDWTLLIKDKKPITSGCGLIYELPHFSQHANESFAIVDMRHMSFAEPHYHPDEHIEIYFVLQGQAIVVIGHDKRSVKEGDVIFIPPNTAHYTMPDSEFVIACVNTPPYAPENYIPLTKTDHSVQFNFQKFKELTKDRG